MNSTKAQCFYEEIYKTLSKEIKDINKWKDMFCSLIGRPQMVKMTMVIAFSLLLILLSCVHSLLSYLFFYNIWGFLPFILDLQSTYN